MLFRATVVGLAISLLFTYFLLLSTFSTCFKALNTHTHTLCLSRICLQLALNLIELFEIAVEQLCNCHMFLHNVIRRIYYCCCVLFPSTVLVHTYIRTACAYKYIYTRKHAKCSLASCKSCMLVNIMDVPVSCKDLTWQLLRANM